MKDKASVKIVVEVEYELNSVPPHLLHSNLINHLAARLKKLLNQTWED
jgi:hypothetical protein